MLDLMDELRAGMGRCPLVVVRWSMAEGLQVTKAQMTDFFRRDP